MDLTRKSKVSLQAPAKVNLYLKVLGRRPDGYHDLDMVMVKLDLADDLEVEIRTQGTEILSESKGVPKDQTNILWQMADRVRQESGLDFGLKIHLTKQTPVAAGLGGGSSDAAALLLGLNETLALGWDLKRMIQVGSRIGADVPFFLVPGAQRARGIGDVLEPVPVEPKPLILVNPGFAVSTADVYRWYDAQLTRGADNGSGAAVDSRPDELRGRRRRPTEAYLEGTPQGALTTPTKQIAGIELTNDLEKVVFPRYPVLEAIKHALDDSGALGTLMSGSGPTVFGLFDSNASRDRGYEVLSKEKDPRWWLWKGRSL